MKKRILTISAIILIVAVCAAMLVACTPSNVERYLKATKDLKSGTIESEGVTYAFDGDKIYLKISVGALSAESYVVNEDGKKYVYSNVSSAWTKTELNETQTEYFKKYSIAEMFKEISVDKADYDIKDGEWTNKTSKHTLKVEDNKLVVSLAGVKMFSLDISKPSINLPEEAKVIK